ncbi:hypothetical protein [Paraburkholderia sediminicola]|uniref:hypothetical protein n=1 Tax=Paraburkholderia sediminicola TaxID=458836 RepID=UPI0038BA3594
MDRVEPILTAPGHASGATLLADWDDTQTFGVRYSIKPPGRQGIFSAIRYAAGINGELSFSKDDITLHGSTSAERRYLQRAEIFDIKLAGRRISFDLHGAQGGIEHAVLKTRSEEYVRRTPHRAKASDAALHRRQPPVRPRRGPHTHAYSGSRFGNDGAAPCAQPGCGRTGSADQEAGRGDQRAATLMQTYAIPTRN